MGVSPSASVPTAIGMFGWRNGYHAPEKMAEPFGNLMAELRERHEGNVLASHVVEAARDPDAEVHALFEWDNEIAGAKYREDQARYYMRAIVEVMETDGGHRTVRAMVSLGDGEGYQGMSDVMSDPFKRRTLVELALKRGREWMALYQDVKELAQTFEIVEERFKVIELDLGIGASEREGREQQDHPLNPA